MSLKSKPAKYINLQKFVTEIFKVKIGLSPKLMKDIYRKTILLANKFSIKARVSKRQNMT